MNLLDENFPEGQRLKLRRKRISTRQIGVELGRMGMHDREIISLLHGLDRATFFTLDEDFCDRRLVHQNYCLVYLDVWQVEAAPYVIRVLRHPKLKTRAMRLGCAIHVSAAELTLWRAGQKEQFHLPWQ